MLLCYSYDVCFSLGRVLLWVFMVTLGVSYQQGRWVDSHQRPFCVDLLCISRVPAGALCGCQVNKEISVQMRMNVISSLLLALRQTAVLSRKYTSQAGGKQDKHVYIRIFHVSLYMFHKCLDLLTDIQFCSAGNVLDASSGGISIWVIAGEFWCKRNFL